MFKMSYSQAHQDMFVLAMLPNSTGTYLDIGANDPKAINNTYLLELNGWTGLSVDYNNTFEYKHKTQRKNPFIVADATTIHWIETLKTYYTSSVIDYLTFDVDDSSEAAFNNFPWSDYTFKIITIEHDSYRFGPKVRNMMRSMLSQLGYICVCKDVKGQGNPYEDWWINPAYISKEIYETYMCEGKEWSDII
jgi:hypothetical protein